ncbi:MAG: RNase adapter RapZ [Nitrospiraceae bacterium]|nr:RNase adapter RapZ [Nitrospiraceae bacterium]|tara:strand:+ start:1204 stop:2079 length:876 start_codon:yes stop_codon:yes gene_type:complete
MSNASGVQLIVITGLSGAGKSLAIRCLEDCGFFCVDNLPAPLLLKFVELCTQKGAEICRVGLGIDIRERGFLGEVVAILKRWRDEGFFVEVLFIEARDDVLFRRFSESRRPHPLAGDRSAMEAIRYERSLMNELRHTSDRIIDTSDLLVHDFRAAVVQYCLSAGGTGTFRILIVTFGYKYGIPYDADLLFDVRFLKNPYFVNELKDFTGENPRVLDFVLGLDETKPFLMKTEELLWTILPLYKREGKRYLTIGIGCTGGRHRSVSIGSTLAENIRVAGYEVTLRHRDMTQP